MKKEFLSILLACILFGACDTPKSCSDFKTGTFKYKDSSSGMAPDVIINRTEEYQVESSESADYADTFKIVWTSDCEYYCIFESSSNPSRMPYSKFDTIFARIVDTHQNGYVFESLFLDKRPQGELILVQE